MSRREAAWGAATPRKSPTSGATATATASVEEWTGLRPRTDSDTDAASVVSTSGGSTVAGASTVVSSSSRVATPLRKSPGSSSTPSPRKTNKARSRGEREPYASLSDLKGLVAVVTNAGSGLGRALALQLRREHKCHLALVDASERALSETADLLAFMSDADLGSVKLRTTAHVASVADAEQVARLVADVAAQHGRAELLFNVPKEGAPAHAFDKSDLHDLDKLVRVGVSATLNTTRLFLPLLKRQRVAAVVNVSRSVVARSNHAAFVAAQFAVRGLTESLVVEAATHFPHVKVVSAMLKQDVSSPALALGGENEDEDGLVAAMDAVNAEAREILQRLRAGHSRVVAGPVAKMQDAAVRVFPHAWYGRRMWFLFRVMSAVVKTRVGRGVAAVALFALLLALVRRLRPWAWLLGVSWGR